MLDTFAGNREIKETLKSIIASGRFPHAFIVEGEQGSGRHALARIIAAAALCNSDNAPCGICRECDLVLRDGHSDVLTYSPDGATFKIDTVREIRDNAYIMPIEAKRKVNILLDCGKMNEPAQNAFLKVLEEPPEFMVFILVCQSASSLLTTVRSRCVTLSVQNPDVAESLSFIAIKLGKPENEIAEALEASRGNIGKAMSVLSGEAALAATTALDFLSAVKSRNRLEALTVLHKFDKDRLGFSAFLAELRISVQRQLTATALGKGDFSTSFVSKLLKIVSEYEQTLRRHVGQPLSVSLLSTALCAEIFTAI